MPQTRGYIYVYRYFIHPTLAKHENTIDMTLMDAQEKLLNMSTEMHQYLSKSSPTSKTSALHPDSHLNQHDRQTQSLNQHSQSLNQRTQGIKPVVHETQTSPSRSPVRNTAPIKSPTTQQRERLKGARKQR